MLELFGNKLSMVKLSNVSPQLSKDNKAPISKRWRCLLILRAWLPIFIAIASPVWLRSSHITGLRQYIWFILYNWQCQSSLLLNHTQHETSLSCSDWHTSREGFVVFQLSQQSMSVWESFHCGWTIIPSYDTSSNCNVSIKIRVS
jgi:hypothetical protein